VLCLQTTGGAGVVNDDGAEVRRGGGGGVKDTNYEYEKLQGEIEKLRDENKKLNVRELPYFFLLLTVLGFYYG